MKVSIKRLTSVSLASVGGLTTANRGEVNENDSSSWTGVAIIVLTSSDLNWLVVATLGGGRLCNLKEVGLTSPWGEVTVGGGGPMGEVETSGGVTALALDTNGLRGVQRMMAKL